MTTGRRFAVGAGPAGCAGRRVLAACSPDAGRAPSGGPAAPASASSSGAPLFREVAAQSGIAFTHANGMSGEFYYAEIIGSGVALFDYDNDGKLDILVLQGAPLGDRRRGNAPTACGARLYPQRARVRPDGTRR